MTTTSWGYRSMHGLRTRPGRLLLSQTAVMGYFGLDPSAYAEEISSLGGPSQKTILRIMRGRTRTIRPNTQERLQRAIHDFELNKVPRILGTGRSEEDSSKQDGEVVKLGARLFELIERSKETHILETIENHIGKIPNASTQKNFESKMVFYNLCIWHGFEYLLHYPHDIDMLVLVSPRRIREKLHLPLHLWAKHHTLTSTHLMPVSRGKNLSQLASELLITKQALNRCITTATPEHLPKFKTMVRWSELLVDSSGELAFSSLSRISLFVARFLHGFYIDVLKNTSLSEQEILHLFSLSEELRALWPSVFLR